ncbi:MAG: hypothetical protein J0I07_16375 [Myxococcales bacterium]|nr:hypothetical protein [Myxococcales bacterium]
MVGDVPGRGAGDGLVGDVDAPFLRVGDQPNGLSLRVTATDGQVVEDTLAGGVQAEQTVSGTKQFQ